MKALLVLSVFLFGRKMSESNLFVTSLSTTREMHRPQKRTGKRKPMKSKPVMRVGGRKISASRPNKVKYSFPVEISYVGDVNL